ncbi:AAA family ATPase [Qipengyuania sp. YG27]|uniref:AAA family ATPase n=1 Tax=Qipengyuania mesophila TaxID=2867246 RepID=A0ABS7JUT0_9SPHN|nr:AAA family ATPase [Qipengyuania mesophila]
MADILITGCSGGGKTTLLDELAARGCRTVAEPGRRLIAQGIAPWDDAEAFLRAAADMAMADLAAHASIDEPVFYDRGLFDALAGLERIGVTPVADALGEERPYAGGVFLAPPWPEIYAEDSMRRHDFEAARDEYEHLAELLPKLGYSPLTLPKLPVGDRADFVLRKLAIA